MSNVESVFTTASTRVRSIASRATPGPYLMSKAVPTALRCADGADGGERHLAYGIARKEDFRLLVGGDPRTFELLADVFAAAAATDAAAPALADLAAYLSEKMGLKLPPVDFGVDQYEDVEPGPAPEVPSTPPPATPAPMAVMPALDAADL